VDRDERVFDAQDARFDQELDYDVVSGLLSEMSADGVGTYGDGKPDSRLNVRDPLDETVPICP
jgi:hypothetical protein